MQPLYLSFLISTGLMQILHDWVREQRSQLPLHLIRFMAHLALFLRTSEYYTKVGVSDLSKIAWDRGAFIENNLFMLKKPYGLKRAYN